MPVALRLFLLPLVLVMTLPACMHHGVKVDGGEEVAEYSNGQIAIYVEPKQDESVTESSKPRKSKISATATKPAANNPYVSWSKEGHSAAAESKKTTASPYVSWAKGMKEPVSAANKPAVTKVKKPLKLKSVSKISRPEKKEKKQASVSDEAGFWGSIKEFFTIEAVRPWQKATLARETMKPAGPVYGAEKFMLKIYTSKEGSRGGTGVAGGGCGCN